MIKNSRGQKGSIHVILAVVIVVALIGGLGFVFWRNFMAHDKTEAAKPVSASAQASQTRPVSKDVVLDDWGVKFTPVASLSDTQVKTLRTYNQTAYAFTTTRIQALGDECTKPPFGDTVILIRFAEKPRATPDGELIGDKPIGGYYYAVTGPPSGCKPGSEVENKDRLALKESLKSLTATGPFSSFSVDGYKLRYPLNDNNKNIILTDRESNGTPKRYGINVSYKPVRDYYATKSGASDDCKSYNGGFMLVENKEDTTRNVELFGSGKTDQEKEAILQRLLANGTMVYAGGGVYLSGPHKQNEPCADIFTNTDPKLKAILSDADTAYKVWMQSVETVQ